jgi:hypothetical protein
MDKPRFIEAVLRNPLNEILLARLPAFGLPDAWLVSGALFQTVWNVLTGRPPDYGIKDYDVFFFDADTSFEAEDAIIRRVASACTDLDAQIEPRNQARVHLWYPQKFGVAYPPLQRAHRRHRRFLAIAAMVGMRSRAQLLSLRSHGFDDLATMTLRPMPAPTSARAPPPRRQAGRRSGGLTILPAHS